MFCPNCKSLMFPGEGGMTCKKCGHTEAKDAGSGVVKEKSKREDIPVIDGDKETLPKTKRECSKCGNHEAFWWLMQTRKADEAETHFYKCTKCGHTWREY